MVAVIVGVTNNGAPLTTPVDLPEITIRRSDTGAVVAGPSAMTELGDGLYRFDFTVTDGIEYGAYVNADPNSTGQVTAAESSIYTAFSGTTETRIETDIPAILVDTGTTIPGLIAALNDLSIADVQTALTNQGYTVARAANLDNIDTAFSDRLILIEKILRNRWEVDPSDGSATLYDDDSITPLLTTTVFQDVAGVQTYQNQGANRRNRLV